MFLEHKFSISKWFLKDRVTKKAKLRKRSITQPLEETNIDIIELLTQILKALGFRALLSPGLQWFLV